MGTSASSIEWDPFMDPEAIRQRFKFSGNGAGGTSKHGSGSKHGGGDTAAGSSSSSSNRNPTLMTTSSSTSSLGNSLTGSISGSHHGVVSASSSTSLSTSIMGNNAPLLYEHALVGDWDKLLVRIHSHPQEAQYTDKCKNMPLHVSCRRQPPPNVVDALIQAYPEALQCTTLDGLTPLHFACFCGSHPDTVRRVLQDYVQQQQEQHQTASPTAATAATTSSQLSWQNVVVIPLDWIDRRGRTPLHCVCAGFRSDYRLDVVRLLLELDPTCATAMDERGRTPLSLMMDDYAEELREALHPTVSSEEARRRCLEKGSSSSSGSGINLNADGGLYECWHVTLLLLKAAYQGTIQDDRPQTRFSNNEVSLHHGTFHMLHAAVGVSSCPSVFVKLILKTHPQTVRVKDGDLNLPLHIACRTVPAPWSRMASLATTTTTTPSSQHCGRGSTVYNADFGLQSSNAVTTAQGGVRYKLRRKRHEEDDITAELLEANKEAASVADEFGKLPFVLAVESGKPWKTSLEPLWEAHPFFLGYENEDGDHEQQQEFLEILQESVDGALTSVSENLRKETVLTLRMIARLWPCKQVDAWTMHLIEFCRDSDGLTSTVTAAQAAAAVTNPMIPGATYHRHQQQQLQQQNSVDGHNTVNHHNSFDEATIALGDKLQASKLDGLASVLNHVRAEDLNLNETPQQALEFALPLLTHKDPDVRMGAANVLGACVSILGVEAREKAFRDVIFPNDVHSSSSSSDLKDDGSLSTIGALSCDTIGTASEPAFTHGRVLALCTILKSQAQILKESQTETLKEWMLHEEALVREAACQCVGHLLVTPADLKEYRSPLRKCMKTTEDKTVLIAVARSLTQAARHDRDKKLFLRKLGLPLLDAALMLSMTAALTPPVQKEFYIFLCWVIEKNEGGLQDYMSLAHGENGRIMMSLATKTLSKLAPVLEEQDDEEGP